MADRPYVVTPAGAALHHVGCFRTWDQHDGADRTDLRYLTRAQAAYWLQARRGHHPCRECQPSVPQLRVV